MICKGEFVQSAAFAFVCSYILQCPNRGIYDPVFLKAFLLTGVTVMLTQEQKGRDFGFWPYVYVLHYYINRFWEARCRQPSFSRRIFDFYNDICNDRNRNIDAGNNKAYKHFPFVIVRYDENCLTKDCPYAAYQIYG